MFAATRPDNIRLGALLFNEGCNKQVFSLNPEIKLAQIRLFVFEKNAKNAPLIPKYDVTEPKAKTVNRLKDNFRLSETMVSRYVHLFNSDLSLSSFLSIVGRVYPKHLSIAFVAPLI